MTEALRKLFLPYPSPKDWEEDFPHENGFYKSICGKCREVFYGHKRRVRCKECANR